MGYYCWKCHIEHQWHTPCPIAKAEEIAATTKKAMQQISDQQTTLANHNSSLHNLNRQQEEIIRNQKEEISILRKVVEPIIAEQARKEREEAERRAREERERIARLHTQHTEWLINLNNQSAKSVFIFNNVKISVHGHLNDPDGIKPVDIYCQAGQISYDRRLTKAESLSITTKDNITTFSDGTVFKRSGNNVYGSDGSCFHDPVPRHLTIAQDSKNRRRFQFFMQKREASSRFAKNPTEKRSAPSSRGTSSESCPRTKSDCS